MLKVKCVECGRSEKIEIDEDGSEDFVEQWICKDCYSKGVEEDPTQSKYGKIDIEGAEIVDDEI